MVMDTATVTVNINNVTGVLFFRTGASEIVDGTAITIDGIGGGIDETTGLTAAGIDETIDLIAGGTVVTTAGIAGGIDAGKRNFF